MSDIDRMREALAQISEVANRALGSRARDVEEDDIYRPESDFGTPGCSIKSLPKRLLIQAADKATRENPANSPMLAPTGAASALGVLDPLRIAVLTAKYWGPRPRKLTVSFMEKPGKQLCARILQHLNAWNNVCGIEFVETSGVGDVRISLTGSGYWSYLGTDILLIPKNRPTMNLQDFSMVTPESEYVRVVQHEAGHTLGFPHEHMRRELVARIDPVKAYPYFLRTQGWDKAMVDAQVLTSLDQRSIYGTPPDQISIMCYQLPASITKDNQPILGGVKMNTTDKEFAASIYPKPRRATPGMVSSVASSTNHSSDDWDESEDVDFS